MDKKTPLYSWHESHGGKIVPFAGYLLPVQYETGVIAEHEAVRTCAGLFDVSHMAEFVITGAPAGASAAPQGVGAAKDMSAPSDVNASLDALANLQRIFTNDFADMGIGRVRYTMMCLENGGIIDDLVVCKMAGGADSERYMLVVNAANHEKDAGWIQKHLTTSVKFEDISEKLAQIALQGPVSGKILSRICDTALIPQKYYTLAENVNVGGINCILSRTGYTGEAGFELYCAPDDAVPLWESLLDAGKPDGLIPCGLGALDTLRLEAGMPLYGHEMDETIDPFEANLAFAVKMNKPDFIGKAALLNKAALLGNALPLDGAPDKAASSGDAPLPRRIRVGIKITGRGIARGGEDVFAAGEIIGKTTSGTFSPHLKEAIAMAIIDTSFAAVGQKIEVDVRGRRIEAVVAELPFYKKK